MVLNWLKEWQFWMALITIFGSGAGGIIAMRKYLANKRQQEFDNYHKLIERINRPLGSDEETYLQVQQAAIFELRNYKRYKALTIKLLKQLHKHWAKNEKLTDIIFDTLMHLGSTNK